MAHEVAERSGEVHAVFRKQGQHHYVVTIVSTGERLPGIVTVEESGNEPPSLECASGSSDRIWVASRFVWKKEWRILPVG
jgi:hypothetical protein